MNLKGRVRNMPYGLKVNFENAFLHIDRDIPKNPTVINLGCGGCLEALTVNHILEPSFMLHIDNEESPLKRAVKNSMNKFSYVIGDINKLGSLLKESSFDVAMMRHPEILGHPTVYDTGMKGLYNIISDKGIVISTTFNKEEAEGMEKALSSAGFRTNPIKYIRVSIMHNADSFLVTAYK